MAQTLAAACLAVGVAMLLRKVFLGGLGTKVAWVTFYPAVMLVALLSSPVAGLLAAGLSCAAAYWGWHFYGPEPFIRDAGDRLGMVAFLVNCAMISAVAGVARRANRKAEQARRQAEEASQAKDQFLASMSHELRTPLNAILGFSGMLAHRHQGSPVDRRPLELIQQSGEHLLAVINDMLDMARIVSGKTPYEPGPCDLQDLLTGVLEMMRPQGEAKGLRLTLEVGAPVPRHIETDERKLRQILLNLLGNAVKYTQSGTVAILASVEDPGPSGRRRLCLTVEDTGPGIAEVDQTRIFEPFVRIDSSATIGGSGLGLALARQHTMLLGGELGLESELGRGSRFTLSLPLVETNAGPARAPGSGLGWSTRLVPGQERIRVLIVEDQEENWSLLQSFLEQVGFDVRVATEGASGVQAFREYRPHFIWMDEQMPVMSGSEAARKIRGLPGGQEIPIVALSASVFEEDRARMLAAGMDDFIRKPFQPDRILEVMKRRLGVTYRVETPPRSEPVHSFDPGRLPEQLRHELREALLLLDHSRLHLLAGEVERREPESGQALRRMVSGFQFSALKHLLEPDQRGET